MSVPHLYNSAMDGLSSDSESDANWIRMDFIGMPPWDWEWEEMEVDRQTDSNNAEMLIGFAVASMWVVLHISFFSHSFRVQSSMHHWQRGGRPRCLFVCWFLSTFKAAWYNTDCGFSHKNKKLTRPVYDSDFKVFFPPSFVVVALF